MKSPQRPSGAADFDFLHGKWRVRHRTLKERLRGSTTWDEAWGIDIIRPAFAGLGNIGRFIRLVDGRLFEGAPIRPFDPDISQWRIYWLDISGQRMEPPVIGGFAGGKGNFFGNDMLRDQPIKVHFHWSEISEKGARWEQSFSPDNGKSWELNSTMEFVRDEDVPDEPSLTYLQGIQS